MSKILYVDNDGTKGTLPEGVLGYDAFTDVGRVSVGDGTNNLELAFVSDTLKNTAVTGTATDVRYDKVLSNRPIIKMVYEDVGTADVSIGDLRVVRYEGDDDSTVFFRDVLTYTANNLTSVDHYFDTADLTTASGTTSLTYVSSPDGLVLDTTEYTEA